MRRRDFIRTSLSTTAAASLGGFAAAATSGRVLGDVVEDPGHLSITTGIPGMRPIEHPGLYTILAPVKSRKTRLLRSISRNANDSSGLMVGGFREKRQIKKILATMKNVPRCKIWMIDQPDFFTSDESPELRQISDGIRAINQVARDNDQFAFLTIQTNSSGRGRYSLLDSPSDSIFWKSNIVWRIRRDDDGYRLDTVTDRHAKPGDPTSFDLAYLDREVEREYGDLPVCILNNRPTATNA